MLYVHTFVNNFFVNYVLIAERLCSVSVAITGLGPDFTSLKSFGSVDAFAESLVKKKNHHSSHCSFKAITKISRLYSFLILSD